jgi:hypothetical protein
LEVGDWQGDGAVFDRKSAALNPEQVDLVLSALVVRRSIDHHAEYVLVGIAKLFPEKVIDFFGGWLRHRDDDDAVDQYEAVPYSFTALRPYLAATGECVLARCRAWHREKPELFEFRGGRLLSVLFPEFTSELEGHLKEMLATEGAGAARFVVDVLAGCRGSPATYEIYKLIVDAVPDECPVLGSVEVALISTGVVSGESGIVEAYQRKKKVSALAHRFAAAREGVCRGPRPHGGSDDCWRAAS